MLRRVIVLAAAGLAASIAFIAFAADPPTKPAPSASAPTTPAPSAAAPRKDLGIIEQVETRLVQIAVTVTDPQAGPNGVPGLSVDDFVIRLDGKVLAIDERQRIGFDPICGPATDIPRQVIVLIDFNYLSARETAHVADALDELAKTAPGQPELYKVYAMTRQLWRLTDTFTRDAATLREAAEAVRHVLRPDERDTEIRAMDTSIFSALKGVKGLEIESSSSFDFDKGPVVPGPTPSGSLTATPQLKGNGRPGVYDAEVTLAAIEALMRAHVHSAGRKAFVLFTSPAFRLREPERIGRVIAPLRELAQQGYVFFPVDSMGQDPEAGSQEPSPLMTALAGDSLGSTVRNSNRLFNAFERSTAQLSCYYLFSMPVQVLPGRDSRHGLDVYLNTSLRPELWRYRIGAPGQIALPKRETNLVSDRLAALIDPEDFTKPPVAARIGYPVVRDGKRVLPVEYRVPVDDLSWTPDPINGYVARIWLDSMITRDVGRTPKPLCKYESGMAELTVPAIPRTGDLVFGTTCATDDDGPFTARGVIADLEAGRTGGARSSVIVRRDLGKEWRADAPRVVVSSGQDFVWTPGERAARRDRERTVWREIDERRPAQRGERVALDYILCGPGVSRAAAEVRHALSATGPGGGPVAVDAGAFTVDAPAGTGAFCASARVTVREDTLKPGPYEFTITTQPGTVLGKVSFTVR